MNQINNMLSKLTNLFFNNGDSDPNNDNNIIEKDLILLISRNVENQRVLEKIITQANYDFIRANSLQIASSFDFKRKYGEPDLIILDLDKKPNEFDLWSLKLHNNVPVIRFVNSKKSNSSDKYTSFKQNNLKSNINSSKTQKIAVNLFISNDVLVERPVSAEKLLMLIAECLNKNTMPIIQ